MITVDTCTLIWDALTPEKLSAKAKAALDSADKILLPDICLWEIALLINSNQLKVSISYSILIDLIMCSRNYVLERIDPKVAFYSVHFDRSINKDPADRMIAAVSKARFAPLVTADKNLRKSKEVKTIW